MRSKNFYQYYPIIILSLLIGCSGSTIHILEGESSEGQQCYKIVTPTAHYLYQKEAGGFSNIFDNQGTDWVQFHKSGNEEFPASSASDYRGLPNLVFRSADGGAGHPGFNKVTSEVVGKNQLRSYSKSGNWQWIWTFHEYYAELEIEKTDPEYLYWFLYEGPIAGKFSPETHYWGTDISGPTDLAPDLIKGPELYGQWQTVYFGDRNYDKVFFVHQLQADTLKDLYTYMGNDVDLANSSNDGMVVFGFGREKGATPMMSKLQKFRIGFYQGKITSPEAHESLIKYIHSLK